MTDRMRCVVVVRKDHRWQHVAARAAHAKGWVLHRIASTFGIPRKRLAIVLAANDGWLAAAARGLGLSVAQVERDWNDVHPEIKSLEAAE